MAELLDKKYRDQLVTWIGRPCHFRLLYKISRDGCSAQKFHQKCDGQGPTVTVLYNTNNTIYGGYLSKSWNSSGGYIMDANAFLFRLQYNGKSSVLQFPVKAYDVHVNHDHERLYSDEEHVDAGYGHSDYGHAMEYPQYTYEIVNEACAGYGRSNYGPTFGKGHDIQTFRGTINKSGNYFPLNGNVHSLGTSYNLNGQNSSSITNDNLQVTDLEVYKVEDQLYETVKPIEDRLSAVEKKMEDRLSAVEKKMEDIVNSKEKMKETALPDKPWRKFSEFNVETMLNLKEEIVDYDTEKESKNTPSRNILLIGQIGAGKSSFFNSVNSVFRGKITSKARTGSFEHSLTTIFRKYTIKDHNSGHQLKLRLCDTRGLEEDSTVDPQDIVYILDGNVADRYQFNPSVPLSPDTLGFVRNPELGDMIHCVAFVVDGSTVDVIPEKILKQIKALQTRMNQKNIPQVVYLTKLDKVCPKVDEDVKHVFYSAAVRDVVDKIADVMGLPRGHVLPIKNYENETDLDPDMDTLILKALKQTINFADDYIEEQMEKKM